MLTHDMVLRAAYSSALTRAFEDGRRILFAMPLYHVFGYVECMIAVTFVGGAIIPQAEFDPDAMLDLAEKNAANEIVMVPVMTMKLIEAARRRGFDSAHLRTIFNSGGANPPTIWDDIDQVLRPRETITAYGMTETTASTTCTFPEDGKDRLLGSNGGLKLAGVSGDANIGGLVAEYKAIDPQTGADLPPGEEGELVARGPIVTKGYYNKPEETAAAYTPDGWLHTGDLGRIGADGYLQLTGRIKESYRCNGEMVMPKEIEDLFSSDPHLEQVLAVGVPDPRSGEAGCLCVVPRSGHVPDADALIARCAQRLARFKVPRHVLILSANDIPLTVTGRPQKFKLTRLASERLAQQKGMV
jgi:fatty-acyl-CoA synthase